MTYKIIVKFKNGNKISFNLSSKEEAIGMANFFTKKTGIPTEIKEEERKK